MMESNEIVLTSLNSVVGVVSIVVLWIIKQTGTTLVAGAKAAAEEGAKTGIKNINWPVELRQELEKSRGVERQELRFKSYGVLWMKLRPLAIYSDKPLNRALFVQLGEELSDWYFSDCGGMFLLPHTRDFYFALQDFVRAVSRAEDWECQRSSDDHRKRLEDLLARMDLQRAAAVREKLAEETSLADWPNRIIGDGKLWRTDIKKLAERWSELDDADRFAVVQQLGSVLRTLLANDVESRMR